MRLAATTAAASLALMLAGCGDTSPADNNRIGTAGDFPEQVAALPEGQRNGVFIRAIRDAGQDCQHVESSSQAGEHQGMPVWTARCAGGGEWTIVIANDGTASVLNPAERQLVGSEADAAANGQVQ